MIIPLLLLLSITAAVTGDGTNGAVTLKHIKTEYLPYSYNPDQYEYGKSAVEKGATDTVHNVLYAVGLNMIHVISIEDLSAISNVYHVILPGDVSASDVSTCGTWVAVSASNTADVSEGIVFIYTSYSPGGSMSLIKEITVGTLPDMLVFTSDCKKILVAIEGNLAYNPAGEPFDAEGEVVIIKFDTNPGGPSYSTVRADFTGFNSRASEYTAKGVRWVYHGEGMPYPNTFSQDLEPEYISLSEDETIAYVILQENNAVARLDVASGTFTEIYSLGEKTWLQSALDPSDMDGDALIQPWGVYGLYQPDGVKMATYNGQTYLVTANEGDAKDSDGAVVWSEKQRGRDFFDNNQIDSDVDSKLLNSLRNDSELGRLGMSMVDYKNVNDKYSKFLSYGGRSFSLFKVKPDGNITMYWDSGDDFEQQIKSQYNHIFNADSYTGLDTSLRDGRSDDKGPEPESIELGDINGTPLIFIGLERPGFVAVYSVDPVTATPQYESITYSCTTGDTWENMYDARTCWNVDPESLRFIPASRSPSGVPLLTVYSTITSTVAVYEIVQSGTGTDSPGNTGGQGVDEGLSPGIIAGVVIACILIIVGMVAMIKCMKKRKSTN